MTLTRMVAFVAILSFSASAFASFIVEPNGVGSGNFAFGGDTTTASNSVASTAPGTSGAASIFGGDGVALPDTYLYTYTPGVDGDNVSIPVNTVLNNADGEIAAGLTAGGTGTYKVYATWPFTSNVSGGPTRYTLNDGGSDLFTIDLDQNGGGGGIGNEWYLLGTATLDASTTYTLTQEVTVSNSFVSMRSGGVLFELVPEPSTALLALLGAVAVVARRK